MKTCNFNDCSNRHDSHGYCANHARQYRKYGHPLSKEEVFERLSEASTKRMLKFYAENPDRPKRRVSPEKRAALKGRRMNTGHTHFKKGFTPWNKGTKGLMKAWNRGIPMSDDMRDKLSRAHIGKRPWNKVGDGITAKSKAERVRFRETLQALVFQRDDYTCQICDHNGGNIQVDHIKSWTDHPELRFELTNCRTLCMACHYYVTFKRKMPKGIVWGHNLSRRIAS